MIYDSAVAARYRAGDRIIKICADFGLSRPTVYRILRDTGTPLDPARRHRASGIDAEAVANLYTSTNLTVKDVAREIGCTVHQAEYALHKLGIETTWRRVYTRKIGLDDAAALIEQGLTVAEAAARLGVSPRTVGVTLNGGDWHGTNGCVDCGATIDIGAQRCRPCVAKLLVKRDDQGRLRCPGCSTWKADEDFRRSTRRGARGRASICRACDTKAKARWRAENPEKCHAADERAKVRRRGRRK
jgi:transposase-like protein/ribosomal protein L40E